MTMGWGDDSFPGDRGEKKEGPKDLPYDAVCIDPIFDMTKEGQDAVKRYNEEHQPSEEELNDGLEDLEEEDE